MNVVSNGIQAVEKTVEGRVVVTARAGAEGLLLTVEDNGPGIPAALMEKIGRPFFSTRAEGTGLGIAQCRRIVGGVGGTFRLESAEGKGTCVFVRVPWAPP
jgi:signal transduction histidine kinase